MLYFEKVVDNITTLGYTIKHDGELLYARS